MGKLIFLFILLWNSSFAQHEKIDSLERLLRVDARDTSRINHLNSLARMVFGNSPDSSILLSKDALSLADSLNWMKGIAASSIWLGWVSYLQGDYPKALEYDLKALKAGETIGSKKIISSALGGIGSIYSVQRDFVRAQDYLSRALKIDQELGDKRGMGRHLVNIGITYDEQKNFSRALDYYQQALKMNEAAGDKMGIAAVSANIGGIYHDQATANGEKPDLVLREKALSYYEKALKIGEELGDQNGIASMYGNIGSLYADFQKFQEAEVYLKKALNLSREIGALNEERQFEELLSDLYVKTGRYALALDHYKRAVSLKDSLFNEERSKELTRKEMNFEFEKKEAAARAEQEKREAVAEAEKKRQQVILVLISCVLLLVIIFAVFIFRSLGIARKQKLLIEGQKHQVEEKQKEILDSIHYAKRIQTALLPTEKFIDKSAARLTGKQNFGVNAGRDFFILYRPKDIVSGDFYYVQPHKATKEDSELLYICTADCTGHGVPGAFMSMLSVSSLNEAIIEKNIAMPHEILNHIRNSLITSLNPEGSDQEAQDGMDCVLCAYDFENMVLYFSAANNPLWLVRNGNIEEYKPDKMPVGKYGDDLKSFTLQTINLQKGDVVYTFTDGFADQFGGPKGKKFKYKQLEEKILEHHQKSMEEQKRVLAGILDSWKGDIEQVDDVLVVGIRI